MIPAEGCLLNSFLGLCKKPPHNISILEFTLYSPLRHSARVTEEILCPVLNPSTGLPHTDALATVYLQKGK